MVQRDERAGMKNCIILGSGRSGTSMVAGALADSGYFMGKRLYPGDEGNPKGYFEDWEVNEINEQLLAQVVPARPSGLLGSLFFRSRIPHMQRWLARVPVGTSLPCSSDLEERIRSMTAREPFCFKDPRFCYTLSAWRAALRTVAYVCVFRHPATTAVSIVTECGRVSSLRSLRIDFSTALEIWELMYSHLLETQVPQGGRWLFIHYDQFLSGAAFSKMESELGVTLKRDFVDPTLNRTKHGATAPEAALSIYAKLCDLAGYSEER
jgi:hypothetical protein